MDRPEPNRRDFHKLTMAALGGLVAGTAVGAEKKEESSDKPWFREPHVCRGLNTCKNKGKGADNACAGQGHCATARAHTCHAKNDCKGQGGCGETAGENSCRGQGECAVPLRPNVWKKARKHYEAAWTKAGKKFGPAPE